jgi:hypothetical protein
MELRSPRPLDEDLQDIVRQSLKSLGFPTKTPASKFLNFETSPTARNPKSNLRSPRRTRVLAPARRGA